MYWWNNSSSSNNSSSQRIPPSARASIFQIPYTTNMIDSRPSTGYGFQRMFEFQGKLWMKEVTPLRESAERNTSNCTGVIKKLPLSIQNSDENEEYSTKIEPKEIKAKPTGRRTRMRTAKTVGLADKNFTLHEIFDVHEASTLHEFLASVTADSGDLFERMEGWQIETRERKNGKFDRFYHHKRSKKMFRSLLMVKMFIKNLNNPPKPARPTKNKYAAEQGALVNKSQPQRMTNKRKRNELSELEKVDALKAKNENQLVDYFRWPAERVGALENQKLKFR